MSNPLQEDVYAAFTGMKLDDLFGELLSAVLLDPDYTILDATTLAARVMSLPRERMIGQKLSDLPPQMDDFHWLRWLKWDDVARMFQRFLDEATAHGSHGEHVYWVTAGQMCYSAIAVCHRNPVTGNLLFYATLCDIANKPPLRRSLSSPVSVNPDGAVITTNGSVISQDDLRLLRAYCTAPSVAALAREEGITPKAMEYRLQKLAEAYNRNSISELVKGFALRDLERFPGPGNTVPVNCHFEVSDAIRYRNLPSHMLPTVRAYENLAKEKRVAVSEQVDRLRAKIAERDRYRKH